MTKQTEALKLALELLEYHTHEAQRIGRTAVAINAIREALAEQPAQQEPICHLFGTLPVYDRPKVQSEQEPVAWYRDEDGIRIYYESKVWDDATPLYTSQPAQRTWVGLTDEEIEKLREKTFSTGNPYCPVDSKSMRKAARAIEAAHGIKGDA